MTTIHAGQLDKYVTLQIPVLAAANTYGEQPTTWTMFARVWARIVPGSGSERRKAESVRTASTYEVTIRYRDDVTSECRMVWNGRTFNVSTPPVNVDEVGEWMQFDVTEVGR